VNTARGDDSSNFLVVDNIRFLPIPEPSTRALLAAGTCVLIGWCLALRNVLTGHAPQSARRG